MSADLRGGRSSALTALRQAYRLAAPYFSSDERFFARTMLVVIVTLNLFVVYLNVVYTYWYKIAYNALAARDAATFWTSMFTYRFMRGFPFFVPGFIAIAFFAIVAAVYASYLSQMLEIRWRRWLTVKFVNDWLGHRAYYKLSLTARPGASLDNPDQRIADDLPAFVSGNLTLGISLLANVVTLVSFIGVLWIIAPPLHLAGFAVPGYLVWAAFVYSVLGTWVTRLIGGRLVPLTYLQQRYNADFRFGLARIRENTEQIALYGGELPERGGLLDRFSLIYGNWWAIMRRTRSLNFFTNGYTQIAIIFPFVVAAPGYFAGLFTLGVLMQISTIFGNVQGTFSWFVTSFTDIVAWRATVQRLVGFEQAVGVARSDTAGLARVQRTESTTIHARDLEIDRPDGKHLFRAADLRIGRGDPIDLTGPSGTGKSTLFRTLAGIWPYARGSLIMPAGEIMFLPQRPYFPLGTLRRAVAYPRSELDTADELVRGALTAVGLDALIDDLDVTNSWSLRLSGGEQQRLALARVLVCAPGWVFLDEALSALDESAAEQLIETLRKRLPGMQIVSITHPTLSEAKHVRRAVFEHNADGTVGLRFVRT